jgi:hypothetical protein
MFVGVATMESPECGITAASHHMWPEPQSEGRGSLISCAGSSSLFSLPNAIPLYRSLPLVDRHLGYFHILL